MTPPRAQLCEFIRPAHQGVAGPAASGAAGPAHQGVAGPYIRAWPGLAHQVPADLPAPASGDQIAGTASSAWSMRSCGSSKSSSEPLR